MNVAETQWILVILAFILGAGLGALAYHLMNSKVAHSIQTSHQLTEKELEVAQLKEGLNDHFHRTADNLGRLKKQLEEMEAQVQQDASHLTDDEKTLKRLSKTTPEEPEKAEVIEQPAAPQKEGDSSVEPPRDYDASGKNSNTLSEDYGLKPEVFEPPRH